MNRDRLELLLDGLLAERLTDPEFLRCIFEQQLQRKANLSHT
jgi:hypothetical protein